MSGDSHRVVLVERGVATRIFSNINELCLYVEPIDVLNGEYQAFDSTGRFFELEAKGHHVEPLEASDDPTAALRIVQATLRKVDERDADSLEDGIARLRDALDNGALARLRKRLRKILRVSFPRHT